MKTLSFRIREVVQNAERLLAQPEIYAALRGARPNSNVFCVEIAIMLRKRQLCRRKATRAIRALNPGVRFAYGPGPVPVFEGGDRAARPRKVVGFMEAARMREAAKRKRRRAA